MKQTLPDQIKSKLAEVERIADGLAATACLASMPSGYTATQDNLDNAAAALTVAELEDVPAMLNSAARYFREAFPADSLGWEEAGRLQTIASDIAAFLWDHPATAANQLALFEKANPGLIADFNNRQENPFSNL